jgi:DNA-binding PadR family transcriptional regulator
MPIAHAVLGVLARGPRHGYELRRALEEELGADWRVDYGQLYRVLARLERAGWVRLHREERATGPTRKVRAITAAGRRELARWSAAPAAPIRQRDATPVQRRFGERLAPLTVGASDDPVLALLGATLGNRHPELGFRTEPLGSLAGLWALRDGRVQLAGVHLLDVDTGLYNVPFVKHLLLEEPIVLLTLVRREQGLMLANGNPLRVRGVRDLVRRGVRLVNRQRGTARACCSSICCGRRASTRVQ